MNAIEGSGRRFADVRAGDTFSSALTITETHIVLGAGLIGDFNPHHVNAEYAKRTRFGTPILHGMLTSSIMGAMLGCPIRRTPRARQPRTRRERARAASLLLPRERASDRRTVRGWHRRL